jgi:two-component system NtrC family sensor kinase
MYQLTLDGVTVERKLNSDLPHLVGDFQQLQQVFLHLISNAKQALNKVDKTDKKLTVSTRYSKEQVRITIEDNGIGISPEFKSRIFDPFFSTKEIGEGTGLGLSICFGIIESHHGKLSVISELDVGSTFTIELPIYAADKPVEDPELALSQPAKRTAA